MAKDSNDKQVRNITQGSSICLTKATMDISCTYTHYIIYSYSYLFSCFASSSNALLLFRNVWTRQKKASYSEHQNCRLSEVYNAQMKDFNHMMHPLRFNSG